MASPSPASPALRPCRWGLMELGTFGGFRGAERRVWCLEWVELRGECWHPKPEQPAPLARPLPHPGVGGGRVSLQGPARLPGLKATLVAWSPLERSGAFLSPSTLVPPPPPQKDASLQPPERLEHRLKHSGKRKRGGSSGATGEPGDSSDREPGRPSGDRARKWPNKRRRKEVSLS